MVEPLPIWRETPISTPDITVDIFFYFFSVPTSTYITELGTVLFDPLGVLGIRADGLTVINTVAGCIVTGAACNRIFTLD